jgi:hypothetical protein
LQGPQERNRLQRRHIVISLNGSPAAALRSEEVVATFLFVEISNACGPVIAEESLKDTRGIHARGY